ncbi:hypothetical protein J7643_16130 [bacterium]|nr:hypothetical protein [bacterium]
MVRLSLGITALTGATLFAPAALAAAEPSFARLVQASSIPYVGELVVNGRTVLKVTQGSGDKRRQEVVSPPRMVGELVVDNGKTRWHYSPRTRQVDITPSTLGMRRPLVSERLLSRNFKLEVGPRATILGRPTRIVEIVPLHPERPRQRLWMDVTTGLPLRTEHLSPKGLVLDRSEFRSIQINAPMTAEAFEFTLPSRAKVTSSVQVLASGKELDDLQVELPFSPQLPSYLPAGFEVLDVQVFERKGVRSVHWRLSDGLGMLSLFQATRESMPAKPESAREVAIDGARGYVMGHGAHRMLCWEVPTGTYSLVGDLGETELTKIASSTAP